MDGSSSPSTRSVRSEKGPAGGNAKPSAGAANYFKHSLQKITDARHFLRCVANVKGSDHSNGSSQNGAAAAMQHIASAVLQIALELERSMGDTFPCHQPSSASVSSPASPNKRSVLQPSTSHDADVKSGAQAHISRPQSVGDPKKRLPLAFELNDQLQTIAFETSLPLLVGGPTSSAGGGKKPPRGGAPFARLQDCKRHVEDSLLVFAEAAYRRHVGAEDPVGGDPATKPTLTAVMHDGLRWWVDREAAVMVHLFDDDVVANATFRVVSTLQNSLFQHGEENMHTLLFALYCIHGQYLCVIPVPPLRVSGTLEVNLAPSSAPQSWLAHNCRDAMSRLMEPFSSLGRSKPQTVSVVPGADGRWYLMESLAELAAVLAASTGSSTIAPSFIPRAHFVLEWQLNNAARVASGVAGSTFEAFVLQQVPAVVRSCVAAFTQRDEKNQGVPALMRDQVLRLAMESACVPMRYLYSVYQCVRQESDGTPATRVYQILSDCCVTEMVARTAKQMTMFDVSVQASRGFIGEADQLEAINRMMRYITTKDPDFLQTHLTPVLRRYFGVPEGDLFSVEPSRVHVPSVLKCVSNRTGAVMLPERNRFEKFASVRDTGIFLAFVDPPTLPRLNDAVLHRYTPLLAAASATSASETNSWWLSSCLLAHCLYLHLYQCAAANNDTQVSGLSKDSGLEDFAQRLCDGIFEKQGILSVRDLRHCRILVQCSNIGKPAVERLFELIETLGYCHDDNHGVRTFNSAALCIAAQYEDAVSCSRFRSDYARLLVCLQLRQRKESLVALTTLIATARRAAATVPSVLPQVVCTRTLVDVAFRLAKDVSAAWTDVVAAHGKLRITFQLLLEVVLLLASQRNASVTSADLALRVMGAFVGTATDCFFCLPFIKSAAAEDDSSQKAVLSRPADVPQESLQPRQELYALCLELLAAACTHARARKGARNANSVMLTYSIAYVSLQLAFVHLQEMPAEALASLQHRVPVISTIFAGSVAVRKMLDKLIAAPKQQVVQSATALVPSSILFKVCTVLERIALSDNNGVAVCNSILEVRATETQQRLIALLGASASLVREHVQELFPTLLSAHKLQSVGRGALKRAALHGEWLASLAVQQTHQQSSLDTAEDTPLQQDITTTTAAADPVAPVVHTPDLSQPAVEVDALSAQQIDVANEVASLRADAPDAEVAIVFDMQSGEDKHRRSPHPHPTHCESAVEASEATAPADGGPLDSQHAERDAQVEQFFEGERASRTLLEDEVSMWNGTALVQLKDATALVAGAEHHRQRVHLETCEDVARDVMVKEYLVSASNVAKQIAVTGAAAVAALTEIVAMDEPSSRGTIVLAEASGFAFLLSMVERSVTDAQTREQQRVEALRSSAADSPLWPLDGSAGASRGPTPMVGRVTPAPSTSQQSVPVGDLQRATSPVDDAFLCSDVAVPSDDARRAMDDVPPIALSQVEPVFQSELHDIVDAWRRGYQASQSAELSDGDCGSEAMQQLQCISVADVDLIESQLSPIDEARGSGGSATSCFTHWLAATTVLQKQTTERRLAHLGPAAASTVSSALRMQHSAWCSLVAYARSTVELTHSGGRASRFQQLVRTDMPDVAELVTVHWWASRRELKAYFRALRALSHAAQDLRLPPNIFAVPLTLRFAFATNVATVTFSLVCIATSHTSRIRQDATVAEVTSTLNAVFSAGCENTMPQQAYVSVTPLARSGVCAVVPSPLLLARCDDGVDRQLRAEHCGLSTHLLDAPVFEEACDRAKRGPHAVERCANDIRRLLLTQRSRGVSALQADGVTPSAPPPHPHAWTSSCASLRHILRRNGVPLSNVWDVMQSETLRNGQISEKHLEALLGTAMVTIVARSLVKLILAASSRPAAHDADVPAVVSSEQEDDGVASSGAATFVWAARILRTFTKSTTMLQSHVSVILAEHFHAPLAMINISLMSVSSVVKEVCRVLGLHASVVDGESAIADSNAVPSAAAKSKGRQFTIAVAARARCLKTTAPRPVAFRCATTSNGASSEKQTPRLTRLTTPDVCLIERTPQARELAQAILLLQTRQRTPDSLMIAVLAKLLCADTRTAADSLLVRQQLTDRLTSASPLYNPSMLPSLLQRHLQRAFDLTGEVLQPSLLLRQPVIFAHPLDDVDRSTALHIAEAWLEDEVLAFVSGNQPLSEQGRSSEYKMYRLALHLIREEARADFSSASFTRMSKSVLSTVIELLCLHVERSRTDLALVLSQRELPLLCALVRQLESSALPDAERLAMCNAILTRVSAPAFQRLLHEDAAPAVCKAFVPFLEASAVLLTLASKLSGDTAGLALLLDQLPLLLLHCLAKATSAHASQETNLTVATLRLQELFRAMEAHGAALEVPLHDAVTLHGKASDSSDAVRDLVDHVCNASVGVNPRLLSTLVSHLLRSLGAAPVAEDVRAAAAALPSGAWLWVPISGNLSDGVISPPSISLTEAFQEMVLQESLSRSFIEESTTHAFASASAFLDHRVREMQEASRADNERLARIRLAELQRAADECLLEEAAGRGAVHEAFARELQHLQHQEADAREFISDSKEFVRHRDRLFSNEAQLREGTELHELSEWDELLTNFYDQLAVMDEESAHREELYHLESSRWADWILAPATDELTWIGELEMGQLGNYSPSPQRGDGISRRPPTAERVSRPDSQVGASPSRSRLPSRQRLAIPMTPGSRFRPSPRRIEDDDDGPYDRQKAATADSAAKENATRGSSLMNVAEALGGQWQRVATPELGAAHRTSADVSPNAPFAIRETELDDEFGPVPPSSSDEEDGDEPQDAVNEERVAAAAALQSSLIRPATPPEHLRHRAYSPIHFAEASHAAASGGFVRPQSAEGLPPLPVRVGSANYARRSTPTNLDRNAILPAEYRGSYADRLRSRTEERKLALSVVPHHCGTQTGMTAPPTPVTPPICPLPVSSLQLSRPSSAQVLERRLQDAAEKQNPGLLLALDILYRSAQQEHALGDALVTVFFTDIDAAAAEGSAPAVSSQVALAAEHLGAARPGSVFDSANPSRFRVPSALTRKRPPFELSAGIMNLCQKVRELEEASAHHILTQCIEEEARLRVIVERELEPLEFRVLRDEEDTHRLMVQERLREMKKMGIHTASNASTTAGASSRVKCEEGAQECNADAELLDLRLQAKAYMNRGPKQLRPPIPGPGVLEMAQRLGKSKTYGGARRDAPNTATEALRAVQEELMRLDPGSVAATKPHTLPPLAPRGGAAQRPCDESRDLVPPPSPAASAAGSTRRLSSATAHRPTSPHLPFHQKSKLTAATLPPILAAVLPDRDFSKAQYTLPPLGACGASGEAPPYAMRTASGPIIAEMAHSALDIARMKQDVEREILRETLRSDVVTEHHNRLTGGRPSSAGVKLTPLSELPESLRAAAEKSQRVTLVQSALKALHARHLRCQAAQKKVLGWLKRILRRVWLRRKSLVVQKMLTSHCRRLQRGSLNVWLAWRNDIHSLRDCAAVVLWAAVDKKITAKTMGVAKLERKNALIVFGNAFRLFRNYSKRQRQARAIESLRCRCVRHLSVRYITAWRTATVSALESVSSVPAAAVSETSGKKRWQSRPLHERVKLSVAALNLQHKADARIVSAYHGKWLALYVRRARRRETVFRLETLIRAKRRQLIEQEVDRVWAIAMMSSGWCRKYLKPFYNELYRRVLEKKPELAEKKWKYAPATRTKPS